MNRICASLCLVMMTGMALGCGGSVASPKGMGGAGGGHGGVGGGGGGGGAGGSAGELAVCPSFPSDQEVQERAGQPCSKNDQTCFSNDGCGGCSITCTDGVWTSTNQGLCYFIGNDC
jgi:hypothetical protein